MSWPIVPLSTSPPSSLVPIFFCSFWHSSLNSTDLWMLIDISYPQVSIQCSLYSALWPVMFLHQLLLTAKGSFFDQSESINPWVWILEHGLRAWPFTKATIVDSPVGPIFSHLYNNAPVMDLLSVMYLCSTNSPKWIFPTDEKFVHVLCSFSWTLFEVKSSFNTSFFQPPYSFILENFCYLTSTLMLSDALLSTQLL